METKKIKNTFLSMIVGFVVFNLFVSLLSNSYFITKRLKENYFFTVDLKKNLTGEEIEGFEKLLLENKDIKGVRFVDKEQAFRTIQNEMGVVIPSSENPLSNSMLISFDDEKKMPELQEFLEKNENVKEIYVDDRYFQSVKKKISGINLLKITSAGFVWIAFFQLVTFFKTVVIKDYFLTLLKKTENKKSYIQSRNKNMLSFLLAAGIGSLIYFNAYVFIRRTIIELLPTLVLQSFTQLLPFELAGVFIVIISAWKASNKLKRHEVE